MTFSCSDNPGIGPRGAGSGRPCGCAAGGSNEAGASYDGVEVDCLFGARWRGRLDVVGQCGRAVLEEPVDRCRQRHLLSEAFVEGGLDLSDAVLEGVETGGDVAAGSIRSVGVDGADPVGPLALDEFGQAVFAALGRGLGLGAGELDLLLSDLGVGGERRELAADLRLGLDDALAKRIDLGRLVGRTFVTEEALASSSRRWCRCR